MILTIDKVKKITRGAVQIEENEDGSFSFFRFTEKGMAHYAERPIQFNNKAHASASVILDFLTDASSVLFDFSVSIGSSRKYYYFDVYVDGILCEHMGEENMWLKKGSVNIDLSSYPTDGEGFRSDGGMRRVCIYLPNLATTRLSNINLTDASRLEASPASIKMIAYGDSITQGYDAVFPSMSYVNRVARHFNADLVNQGVGGESFVPEIIDDVGFEPDIITVSYGTNDWSQGDFERLKTRCELFFAMLEEKYPGSIRFCITPIWRADGENIAKKVKLPLDTARDYIAKTAKEYSFHILDGRDFVPHHPYFYWDSRVHPNDLGFAEYANGVVRGIEKILRMKFGNR